MANETILTGIAHPTDVYTDAVSAALVARIVLVPLIYSEDLPVDTTVKYFRKAASLTASASALAEAGNYTTNSQWAPTAIAVTAVKDVCCSFVTVESQQFGRADNATIARAQGEALARRLDNEIAALFAGFSTGVTATSVCTVNDVMDAAYTVRANTADQASSFLNAVLSLKSVNALRKEQLASGASVYSVESFLSLLGAGSGLSTKVANPGYVGSLPGVNVFQFAGTFATGSGDDTQAVFDPAMALAGVYGRSVQTKIIEVGKGNPSFGTEISSWVFHGVSEWNDYAGCMLKSDT